MSDACRRSKQTVKLYRQGERRLIRLCETFETNQAAAPPGGSSVKMRWESVFIIMGAAKFTVMHIT